MNNEKGLHRFGLRIIVSTLVFSLVPLVVLGVTIYTQFSEAYRGKVEENLRTLVDNKRQAIDLFLSERVTQLKNLAYTHTYDQLASQEAMDGMLRMFRTNSRGFIDIGVIDEHGAHIAYSGPYRLAGLNYEKEVWFHEVMLRGVYISDVFTGFREFPHLIIAVLRHEGNRKWILRATLDSDLFETMVRAVRIGRRGDAYLVNEAGLLQTRPRFKGDLLGQVDLPVRENLSGVLVKEILSGGERLFAGMTWLEHKKWLLVVQENPSEQLMPLFRARRSARMLLGAGALVILIGVVWMAGIMTRQLIMADRDKATLDAELLQASKMAALGRLAAGVAHEVNNPLAVIKEKAGWMRDLLEEEDVSASENFREIEDAVLRIEEHADRARTVVHRMLGFARRMEPVREDVDVNSVLTRTLAFLENEARFREIDIVTDLEAGLPGIVSDTSQLQQVFLNILNNAIDAVGRSGTVTVRTFFDSAGKKVVASISDTGTGMTAEVAEKIFDPFFSTKKVGEGTGLGLSISYSIIAKLGGVLRVQSEPGGGSTFFIELPAVEHANP